MASQMIERTHRPTVATTVPTGGRRVGRDTDRPGEEPTIGSGTTETRRRPHIPARRRPPSGLVPLSGTAIAVPCPEVELDAGYRMGRWARLAVTVATLAAAVVAALVLISGPAESTEIRQVTVRSGDTLWEIATANAPGQDPRAVVDEIQRLNGLGEGALPVGVVLSVPAG